MILYVKARASFRPSLQLADRRILVTGGLGFIGSHLCEKLLDLRAKLTIFDNFDNFYPGKEENLKILQSRGENFQLVHGDILNAAQLDDTVKQNELIFHLAAQAGIRYCNLYPLKANSVNVTGTLNVLQAARKQGVRKIVYASSSSIFGDPLYLPIDESHPTNPNSPYGVSKLAGEHYVRAFGKIFELKAACLRYFSVYGPRGRPDQVIFAFADKISKGKSPEIFGSGEQTRDFTFVSDVVNATILAMENEDSMGEVFNIGHGSRSTVNELALKVAKGMGKEIEPHHVEQSKGDFSDTEANYEKAKRLLGWNPKVSLDEGLKKFLDWYVPRY